MLFKLIKVLFFLLINRVDNTTYLLKTKTNLNKYLSQILKTKFKYNKFFFIFIKILFILKKKSINIKKFIYLNK